MGQSIKSSLEILGIILSLTIAYYELRDVIPTEQRIVLEVEKLQTPSDMPAYILTGVVSDQDYSLETARVTPYSENPVKRATFRYDHYTKDVDLIPIQMSNPHTYLVSRALLQQEFREYDSFLFEFLDDNRFTFYFQFEGRESDKTKFECRMLALDNTNVPCEIREKGYLSLFRGVPWYFLAAGLGIALIIMIEVFDIFLKRGIKKTSRGKRNRLIADQD